MNPAGTEVCGDGLDNDCDGKTDADDPIQTKMRMVPASAMKCPIAMMKTRTSIRVRPRFLTCWAWMKIAMGRPMSPVEGSTTYFADIDGDGFVIPIDRFVLHRGRWLRGQRR